MKYLITIIDRLDNKNGGEIHGHWAVETDADLVKADYDALVSATAKALNYGLDEFHPENGLAVEVKSLADMPTFSIPTDEIAPKFPDLGCGDDNPEGCSMESAGIGFECQAMLSCGHTCRRYFHPGDKHFNEIKVHHDYWKDK